jgi:hypothetical protein
VQRTVVSVFDLLVLGGVFLDAEHPLSRHHRLRYMFDKNMLPEGFAVHWIGEAKVAKEISPGSNFETRELRHRIGGKLHVRAFSGFDFAQINFRKHKMQVWCF